MSFPKYEAYKDSGVEWLGEVPEHWSTTRAKFVSKVFIPQRNKPELNTDKGLPWLTMEDMTGPKVSETVYKVDKAAAFDAGSKILVRGSVIASCVGNFGITAINESDVIINQQLQAFIPTKIYPEYLREIVGISGDYFNMVATSATVSYVNQEGFSNLPLPLPTISEQAQIARFLDHETARIDALIAEQQRLIELLKEKRQAVISHAVTKGLDPTAPMKDSGVEWLGEVPANWQVSCLKRFWSVTDCKHITAEFVDDGIPLASIREVQSHFVKLEGAKQTTKLFYEQLIEGGREPLPGDLIFSRNATVGEVAQVAEWHPPFAMGQDVCLIRKQSEGFSSDYFQAVLRSLIVTEQLENLMVGATFKRINVEEIRGLVVPMPLQDEQAKIADYLEEETTAFHSLLSEATHTIALLQERRSALISAAVTGKIDVRGWQAPASASPAPTLEPVHGR